MQIFAIDKTGQLRKLGKEKLSLKNVSLEWRSLLNLLS